MNPHCLNLGANLLAISHVPLFERSLPTEITSGSSFWRSSLIECKYISSLTPIFIPIPTIIHLTTPSPSSCPPSMSLAHSHPHHHPNHIHILICLPTFSEPGPSPSGLAEHSWASRADHDGLGMGENLQKTMIKHTARQNYTLVKLFWEKTKQS